MANPFVELIRLLPSTDTVVGKILAIDINLNMATLYSIGGAGSFIANIGKGSTYTVGDWVLVKDNVIISTIPTPQGGVTPEEAKDIVIY